jgi:hypothetical protein
MALRNDRHIGNRGLQGAAALLLGDKAGYASINLIGKKPFRAY